MKKLIFLLLLFTSVSNYAQKKSIQAPLLHSVYFWLENPNSKLDRATFEAAIQKLIITNPQGLSSYLGKPAFTETREVVDNSYTYAYIMTFANRETEAAYQSDPTHLRFIDEAKHLWKKVVVYDAVPILN